MDWDTDRGLQLRMALSFALLVVGGLLVSALGFGLVSLALAVFLAPMLASVVPADGLSWVAVGVAAVLTLSLAVRLVRGTLAAPDHLLAGLDTRAASEPVHRDLLATVRSSAQVADLPVPSVLVARTSVPLALVTGRSPPDATLVVSSRVLRSLSSAELAAVVAHELAHVKHRDVAVSTFLAVPLVVGNALVARVSGDTSTARSVLEAVPYFLGVALVATGRFLLAPVARARQHAADRGAVAITGEPAALASALERLDGLVRDQPATDLSGTGVAALSVVAPESDETPGLGPEGRTEATYTRRSRRLSRLLYSTHPRTENRIARLRALERANERQ